MGIFIGTKFTHNASDGNSPFTPGKKATIMGTMSDQ